MGSLSPTLPPPLRPSLSLSLYICNIADPERCHLSIQEESINKVEEFIVDGYMVCNEHYLQKMIVDRYVSKWC